MQLLVTTPTSVIEESGDVRYLRGEDASGAFGILPGHADFITVLAISVLTWIDATGAEHHVALRGGVLSVRDGAVIEIATKEAAREDQLVKLGETVLEHFRATDAAEEEARSASARLHVAAIRQIQRVLGAPHNRASEGAIPTFGRAGAQPGEEST